MPSNVSRGVRVQTHFVLLCMALLAAFRAEKAKTQAAERRGAESGMSRYRRALLRRNRNKVAVFIGHTSAILRSWEVAVLAVIVVRERAERFGGQQRARRTNGSLMLLHFPCGGIVCCNGFRRRPMVSQLARQTDPCSG